MFKYNIHGEKTNNAFFSLSLYESIWPEDGINGFAETIIIIFVTSSTCIIICFVTFHFFVFLKVITVFFNSII